MYSIQKLFVIRLKVVNKKDINFTHQDVTSISFYSAFCSRLACERQTH